MASYEEQLAAYRQQLADAAAPIGQASQAAVGPSIGQTASVAFNSFSSDMASLANLISYNPSTPHTTDIQPSASYYQPSITTAALASSGMYAPPMGVNAGQYRDASRRYVADAVGDAARRNTMSASGIAAGAGSAIAFEAGAGMLFGGATATAIKAAAAAGAKGGAALLGGGTGLGAVVGGSAIGGPLGTAVGTLGGGALGVAGAVALPALAGYAAFEFGGKVMEHAESRSQMRDYLQQSSWRYRGGKGFNKEDRRDIAGNLASSAASDRDFGFDEIQGILQQGTEMGMFNATKDAGDFKKKFKEIKEGLKTIVKTMKVSLEEGMQMMSELKQGGFYTGTDQAAASVQGAALGRGAGYSAREMHEVGLRGAAAFRGTGIATGYGYNTAQSNLSDVANMQQGGMVEQETLNQLGGKTGAANALTSIHGKQLMGSTGRQIGALLVGPQGEEAKKRLLAGEEITSIFKDIRPDYKKLTASSVAKAISDTGASDMETIFAQQTVTQAKGIMEAHPGMKFEAAFKTVTEKGYGMSVGESDLYYGKVMNAGKLHRGKARDLERQLDESARDELIKRDTWYEYSGLGRAERGIDRFAGKVSKPFSEVGEDLSDSVGRASMWLSGDELVKKGPVDLRLLADARKDTTGSRMLVTENAIGDTTLERFQGRGQAITAKTSKELDDAAYRGDYVYRNKINLLGAFGVGPGYIVKKKDMEADREASATFREPISDDYSKAEFWKKGKGRNIAQRMDVLLGSVSRTGKGDWLLGRGKDVSLREKIAEAEEAILNGDDVDENLIREVQERVTATAKSAGVSSGVAAAAMRRATYISDDLWKKFGAPSTSTKIMIGAHDADKRENLKRAGIRDILGRAGVESAGGRNMAKAGTVVLNREAAAFQEYLGKGGYSAILDSITKMEGGDLATGKLQTMLHEEGGLSPTLASAYATGLSNAVKKGKPGEVSADFIKNTKILAEDFELQAVFDAKSSLSGAAHASGSTGLAAALEKGSSMGSMVDRLRSASDKEIAGLGGTQWGVLGPRIKNLFSASKDTEGLSPEDAKILGGANIKDENFRDLYTRRLSKKTGIDQSGLKKAFKQAAEREDTLKGVLKEMGSAIITEHTGAKEASESIQPRHNVDKAVLNEIKQQSDINKTTLDSMKSHLKTAVLLEKRTVNLGAKAP